MASPKEWIVINVSLLFIIVLLTLNLVGLKLPSLGQAIYALDQEPLLLTVEWKGELTNCLDLNRCCLEAREQVECIREPFSSTLGKMDWVCRSGNKLHYRMNNKAYNYCQLQPWS